MNTVLISDLNTNFWPPTSTTPHQAMETWHWQQRKGKNRLNAVVHWRRAPAPCCTQAQMAAARSGSRRRGARGRFWEFGALSLLCRSGPHKLPVVDSPLLRGQQQKGGVIQHVTWVQDLVVTHSERAGENAERVAWPLCTFPYLDGVHQLLPMMVPWYYQRSWPKHNVALDCQSICSWVVRHEQIYELWVESWTFGVYQTKWAPFFQRLSKAWWWRRTRAAWWTGRTSWSPATTSSHGTPRAVSRSGWNGESFFN